ncbi:YihY/virulence factor BrkB family protein [Anaerococcus rubeinfantis]|uniref:YihY/virulence factor BrkB family protein n=1 Tax=Anaerococcus rubeinfantis TaxID=1720199 RepID=UPI00073E664F|nr:YihY/virulence factor BrkB family protein [Anaerococcus rubeinfantis]
MKINQRNFKKFIVNLIERIKNHDLMTLASSLSYYFLSAAIPMLLVLSNLVTRYMKGNEDVVIDYIKLLPDSIRGVIMAIVKSIIDSSSVSTISTITLIFALWSASKGVSKLILAINVAYGLEDDHSLIKNKIFGFLYTFVLIFILIFIFLLRIYSKGIFNLIDDVLKLVNSDFSIKEFSWLVNLISGIVPPLILIFGLSLLYKFAPYNDSVKISFKDALVGSISTGIMITITSFAYSFFLNNLSNMSVIYGALAGIIALLVWMLLFSLTIILGAEITAAYMKTKNTFRKLK